MINYFDKETNVKCTDNVLNKWVDLLDDPFITHNLANKLENLYNFVYTNYYDRKQIKNVKIITSQCFELFIAVYQRNNLVDEITYLKKFDNFINNHKNVFYTFDLEKIILYMNIFIETY